MLNYREETQAQLNAEYDKVKLCYEDFKKQGLKLDMSRGKPGADQLDLSMRLLETVTIETGCFSENGTDCRNYGVPDGLPEAKRLFAAMMEVSEDRIIVGGNSSLNMMFDFVAQCMVSGISGCEPWMKQGVVKFVCPSPGYDRHFAICEHFGIEMIPVAMMPDGPDMQEVERLVSSDKSIKGMWCVPKYSNPQGITYSDDVVRRIAALKPAAPDFRIIWDNAYAIHHVNEQSDELLPILDESVRAGNPDLAVMFASTSKVTFPGGGIAAVAANEGNLSAIKKRIAFQTICPDKINQLRHARMFPNMDALARHMKEQAQILTPKFELVLTMLERGLGELDILGWTCPHGGYFVSIDTMPGCASRVVQLCKEAGVVLTGAGATYPYGKDPLDSNIRIAPTFPPMDELKKAMELLVTAIKLASLEILLSK